MKMMEKGPRFWCHLHRIPKWCIQQWPKYSPRQKQTPSFATVQGKKHFSNFPGDTLPGKGRSLQCSHQPINDVRSNQILTEVIYLDHLYSKSLTILNAYILFKYHKQWFFQMLYNTNKLQIISTSFPHWPNFPIINNSCATLVPSS